MPASYQTFWKPRPSGRITTDPRSSPSWRNMFGPVWGNTVWFTPRGWRYVVSAGRLPGVYPFGTYMP